MAHIAKPHIVVMGVSGCGKSVLGLSLAERLGLPFIEGDDLHPVENIARMSRGLPLDDDMRWPWLDRVAAELRRRPDGAVASCSALKRSYRERLTAACRIFFVHPVVDHTTLVQRMTNREHFMPVSLLESQMRTLEPLEQEEYGCCVSDALPFDRKIDHIISALPAG